LITTSFQGIEPDDKSGSLWTLSLITPEVGSFIVEAAKASDRTRKVVQGWFDILKDLRRWRMPRSGMRFFMELHELFSDALASVNDPWFIWLKYFAANRAVEFAPKTSAATEQLNASLRFLAGNKEQQAATLMLFAEVFSRPSDARGRMAAPFIAKWLAPTALRDAVQAARDIGRNEHHYVAMDANFSLWTLLYSAKVESNPPKITIDLRELRKRASAALTMGFADEQEENLPEEFRFLPVPAQGIYRAWGIRESELEKVRPYFTDAALRGKILPLEIVRTAREDQKLGAPVKPVPRETLTLRKRGPNVA
jgi:hypothetical protein